MDIPAVPFQYVKDCVARKEMIPMRDWFGGGVRRKRNDVYYQQRTNESYFRYPTIVVERLKRSISAFWSMFNRDGADP